MPYKDIKGVIPRAQWWYRAWVTKDGVETPYKRGALIDWQELEAARRVYGGTNVRYEYAKPFRNATVI
jgi:hypothetical protein